MVDKVLAPLMEDTINLESVLGLYLLVVIFPDPFFNATVFFSYFVMHWNFHLRCQSHQSFAYIHLETGLFLVREPETSHELAESLSKCSKLLSLDGGVQVVCREQTQWYSEKKSKGQLSSLHYKLKLSESLLKMVDLLFLSWFISSQGCQWCRLFFSDSLSHS